MQKKPKKSAFFIRGQSSLEYLYWTVPLLLIVSVMYLNTMSDSVQTISFNKGSDAVESLAKAADTVHSMGPGSMITTWISHPEGIVDQRISGHTINYKMKMPGGAITDIMSPTKGTITGYVPRTSRSYDVPVRMLDSGIIMIGWGMLMDPPHIYLMIPEGMYSNETTLNLTNERLDLANPTEDAIGGISCNVSGAPENWTLTNTYPSNLNPGESGDVNLVFSVPNEQTSGLYEGRITCSGNDSVAESELTIEVPQELSLIVIKTYIDSEYMSETSEYNLTQPVFFKVSFMDHAGDLTAVSQFNITLKNETHIFKEYLNLSTTSGLYHNAYYLSWDAFEGVWTLEVSAYNHNGYEEETLENESYFNVSGWSWGIAGDDCGEFVGDLGIFMIGDFEDYENPEQLQKDYKENDEEGNGPCGNDMPDCVPDEDRAYVFKDDDPWVIDGNYSLKVNITFNKSSKKEFYSLWHRFFDDPPNNEKSLNWQGYHRLRTEIRAPLMESISERFEFRFALHFLEAELECDSAIESECFNECGCSPKADEIKCECGGNPACLNKCFCSTTFYWEPQFIEYWANDSVQIFDFEINDVDRRYNLGKIIGITFNFTEIKKNDDQGEQIIYVDNIRVIPYNYGG
ncbi:MAG: hypothetical protein ABH950_08110 [Candidatus Altiarchaeota archaeon]